MWTGVRDNLDLGQPALGALVGLIELMGAVHQQTGMSIFDQPIVQR